MDPKKKEKEKTYENSTEVFKEIVEDLYGSPDSDNEPDDESMEEE